MTGAALAPPPVLYVDAHVHIHPAFDLPVFVESCARNVAVAARSRGEDPAAAIGVLLLSEGLNEGAFARLESAIGRDLGRWTIHATDEAESLLIRESGSLRLAVIAGRQLVSSEGVEVLALLTPQSFRQGAALTEMVAEVRRSGAIPVLPWGFGKWTLRRGALVAALLRSSEGDIHLGDNSGRLRIAPTPRLFGEARSRGIPILPGTDPLPFRDQQRRAGSFGFLAETTIDPARPASSLRRWIRDLRTQPHTYGSLEMLPAFCWNQVRMQWRKRMTRPFTR